MKKIYLLGLASMVVLGVNAQTTIKVKNTFKGKMKYENATSKNGNSNSVQQIAGTLTCNTQYVAGTTMDLQFTLNLTNTDDEYCDLLSLTFPAGITPNSSPNDPLVTPAISASATPTQLNPIAGQTISWGTDDDANQYGGIFHGAGSPITFTVNVTIDANVTGNQTVNFLADGDTYGATPGDLNSTSTIYPAGAQLVDLFVMGVRPINNINLDRSCGFGLDTVLTLVKNIGTTTESNIAVNYSVNGVAAGSTVIPGPLAPGDSTFAFFLPAYDFTGTGAKTLKAWVAQANDIAAANDTVTEGFFNAVPAALTSATYTNGIEAGNEANSLSIFGTAAPFTGISQATIRSGAQALFTTVNVNNGGVDGTTYSYQLILPCMDVVQGETYRIVYYRRTNGTAANANGETAVYTGTESSEAGMSTELLPYSPITTYATWLKDSVEYTATASETRYFSISGRGTVSSASQMNVRIDDISIFKVPTVGVKENVATDAISIFPNPNNGVFTVKVTENEAKIEIFSIIGENVYTSKVVKGNNTIDLSNLAAGSYIVKINNGGKATAKRIVINK
jgi:hypothetical protein